MQEDYGAAGDLHISEILRCMSAIAAM